MKILNNYVVECSDELVNSQIVDDKVYEFPVNSFITDITVSIEPKNDGEPIFYNVEQTNCIQVRDSNSHYQAIYIPKGCYELDTLTALLNDNLVAYDVTIDIITSGENFGKAKITLLLDGIYPDIKFESAPDIMRIYQFNQEYYKGTYISNNVVDITSGLQNLSIYSPIVKGAIESVMHSKNNLLCTMQITNITGTNTQQFNNVFIPVQRYSSHTPFIVISTETNKRVTFNARMTIHMNVSVIQPHLKTDNVDDVIQTDLHNSMKLLFPVQSAEQTFDFTNTAILPPNSYITRVTVLADAEISNITSDNVVVIDGQNLTFKHGTYDLDKFMSILAESTATFNLIMSGENTYKMKIEDFQYINFEQAQEVKNILGFTQDILRCTTVEKTFQYTAANNSITITYGSTDNTYRIPEGIYTEKQFVTALEKVFKKQQYFDTTETDQYYEFISKRALKVKSTTLTGWYTPYNEGSDFIPLTSVNIPEDVPISVTFENSDYSKTSGTIEKGTYTQSDLMNKLLTIVNSTGARWFIKGNYIQRNNNNASRIFISNVDKLPILGGQRDGDYYAYYIWDAFAYRVPKLGYMYITPMTISLSGGREYFYLNESLQMQITGSNSTVIKSVNSGKQSIYTVLDAITAAANGFEADSMKYTKTTGGANVRFSGSELTVGIIASDTGATVYDILFAYFGIPNRLAKGDTFTFASPFNSDFDFYTTSSSVDIPSGTSFKYTVGTDEYSFTFSEKLTASSPADVIDYINQNFFVNIFGGSMSYNKTPLGIKIQHFSSDCSFGRTTSGKQLLDYLSLESTEVFFRWKPSISHMRTGWRTPLEYLNSGVINTLKNELKMFTTYCKKCDITKTEGKISIDHTGTPLSLTYTTNYSFVRKEEDANTINLYFENPPYTCYVDKPLTITAGNNSKTINFNHTLSQEELIGLINDAFFSMNVPISWKLQESCYSIVANQSFTFSGDFKDNELPSEIIPFGQSTQVVTFDYWDGASYKGIGGVTDALSSKVINLTNNKEVCKIYCDLVKSWWGCNGLLTTLSVTDLHKNYYSDIELIPIKTSFNTVNFKIHDLADNPYSFNGVIYIELELSNPL